MTTTPIDKMARDFEAKYGEDLRTLVLTELAGVRHDLELIRALVDSRQQSLGFLSVEAAKVQDDLIRKERGDRARHAREGVKPSGVVPAPGAVNALSLLAEWADLLAGVERSITTRLLRAGVCHVTTRPMPLETDDIDVQAELRYVRVVDLVHVITRGKYLRRVHADVVDLHTRVIKCIDGSQIKAMPFPCPWCGRDTLVADVSERVGEIVCGRDPATGDFSFCRCTDSYCPCQAAGNHRHTWWRDRRTVTSGDRGFRFDAESWAGLQTLRRSRAAQQIDHRPTTDPTTEDNE